MPYTWQGVATKLFAPVKHQQYSSNVEPTHWYWGNTKGRRIQIWNVILQFVTIMVEIYSLGRL